MTKLHVHYHKRTEKRFLVFLGDLNMATVSYSEAVDRWFVHFNHISSDVYELGSKKECHETILEKCEDFLKGCYEESVPESTPEQEKESGDILSAS